jgi:hypothetical protein
MADPKFANRVTVLARGRGALAFTRLADPRIVVLGRDDHIPAETPDLIVFAGSKPADLTKALQQAPPALWTEQVRAHSVIVFDVSGEGWPHQGPVSEQLHGALKGVGIAPRRAALVTQNRLYRSDYEAFCAGTGLTPMPVLNYDFWIRRFFSGHEGAGELRLRKRKKLGPGRRPVQRSRRFVSLSLTPRPSKVLVLLQLLADGLWDLGHISFGGLEPSETHPSSAAMLGRQLRRDPYFAPLAQRLWPCMPALEAKGRVLLLNELQDPADPLLKMSLAHDGGLPAYYDSWFSVITESEMTDRPIRITEKPFAALVNFQPLVVFGNPGSLALIRELGFQTFDGFIDEAYDTEPNPARRFELAYAQVARLCRLDETELARMEAELAETLRFNAQWGLVQLPRLYMAEDVRFVDRLLAATGFGADAA